jgi:hypothetical protein
VASVADGVRFGLGRCLGRPWPFTAGGWSMTGRIRQVRALGVDDHSFLAAIREHRTIFVTASVDLGRRRMIDLFDWKSATRPGNWSAGRPKSWLRLVRVRACRLMMKEVVLALASDLRRAGAPW